MKTLLAALLCAGAAAADAASTPAVTITLAGRQGQATPVAHGFTHTGGGNIDVAQPAPDTVVVTLTGVAVAGGHPCKDSAATLAFDLEQCFAVTFNDPKVRSATLSLEGRVIGLLRSHCKGGGFAAQCEGTAAITCEQAEVLALTVPACSVAAGMNLSVNVQQGPVQAPAAPTKYTLHAHWAVTATHPRSLKLCKASSAEFAPEPALNPLWISAWEPFHGAAKKEFGFQLTLKVAADAGANGAGPEKGKP